MTMLPPTALAALAALAYAAPILVPLRARLPPTLRLGLVAGLLVASVMGARLHESHATDPEGLFTLGLLMLVGFYAVNWQRTPDARRGERRATLAALAALLIGVGALARGGSGDLLVVAYAGTLGVLAREHATGARGRIVLLTLAPLAALAFLLPPQLLAERIDQVTAAFATGALMGILLVSPDRTAPQHWIRAAVALSLAALLPVLARVGTH